jgi:tetratricopeptide (TPR) repeat protein
MTDPTSNAAREALVREAQRLQRLEQVPEAIQAYERVLAQWPELATCWYNLGLLQRKARRPHAALESYEQALRHGISEPEEVHLNRGVIYADYLRRDEAAERELRQALALNPQYIPALLNLGNLCEDLGRREEARELYERIRTLDPGCLEALARAANLQPRPSSDARLRGELERALASPQISAADRASLGFALGRLLDGCAEYASAFKAYTAANHASRASVPAPIAHYDRGAHEGLIDRLIRCAAAPRQSAVVGASATAPIFICGMFRSGSTLTEELIAAHPRVRAGGELDFLPWHIASELAPFPESLPRLAQEQIASLARRYLDELALLFPDAAYVTDKRVENFLYLGLIKSLFPEAKIVHTKRDPLDNCLSIFFQHLNQRMSYALDLMDIGHYYREYLRLMAHWRGRYAADIFDFDYDTFVRDPSAGGAALYRFLGLEWDERYLARPGTDRAVKTASVWQVREPLHARSSGRARHYAQELAALRDYLAAPPAR